MCRYLIDENLSPEYRAQLLNRAPLLKVLAIGDIGAPARSTSDPDILNWCEKNDFILVTRDPNTIPKHLNDHIASGNHVPGVFMIKPNVSMGVIIDQLVLVAGASDKDEYIDQIIYIPL